MKQLQSGQPRALKTLNGYNDRLSKLHDELAEIKASFSVSNKKTIPVERLC